MKHKNWRELAEAVGFVTIVVVLVMIALEQRSANRIADRVAEAEAQRSLAAMQTSLYMARAGNPEVARVFAKMATPQGQLITATDTAQIEAIARQYINIGRAAQFAFDRGLLPQDQLDDVRHDLEATIDAHPGLHAALVAAFESVENGGSLYVLEPVARLAGASGTGKD